MYERRELIVLINCKFIEIKENDVLKRIGKQKETQREYIIHASGQHDQNISK